MLKNSIGLVYGASKLGLMGKVSQTVYEGGGNVLGVISEPLHAGMHDGYGKTIIVKTMSDMKNMMFDKADGFIVLPGGYGTLEELLEIIGRYQMNYNKKPIGVLNVNHYYDKFLEWVKESTVKGFISAKVDNILKIHTDPAKLLQMLKEQLADNK